MYLHTSQPNDPAIQNLYLDRLLRAMPMSKWRDHTSRCSLRNDGDASDNHTAGSDDDGGSSSDSYSDKDVGRRRHRGRRAGSYSTKLARIL